MGLMKHVLLALLCAPTLAYADCPPPTERTAEHSALMGQLRSAENETQARDLNNALWAIWTTAPDAAAQAMLDEGMSRRASFDFLGAIKALDRLVVYCPQYPEGYNQRAFVHFLRQNYPAALRDLQRVLEMMPDHIGAASGLALTFIEMGRHDEGQAALRYALSLNPWLPERHALRPAPGDAETVPETEL